MANSAMPLSRSRKHFAGLFGIPLVLALTSGEPVPAAGASLAARASQSGAVQGSSAGAESPLPVFEMHSGFWVNLHHFLYLQARLLGRSSSPADSTRGAARPDDDPVSLTNFPEGEIRAWREAVDFYSKDLANRDLLVNSDMEIINNQLSALETCSDLEGKTSVTCKSGLRRDLVEALERAAPVYRAHWWPQQDRANREWVAQVAPLIEKMGVDLSGQLAGIYRRPWPAERIRVDVVWYGGPYGAYTSLDPTHVTVASHDPRNQGIYGFEVLFHEASHALAGGVSEAIAREFRDRDKPIPRDFWHALLFYTAGEMVRRDVESGTMALVTSPAAGSPGYQPYAARFGLYSGSWERFRVLLDLYWRPYLDGKTSFDRAIAQLAAEM